ncbi:MAG: O-antigen ligase family protein [Candidatus Omnitrophica bacterium]|nr:O-antigen ligase family protein [Candidatus Omnitrophota bacterium]
MEIAFIDKWIIRIDRAAFVFFLALAYFLPISNALIESLVGFIILCFILRILITRPFGKDIAFLYAQKLNRVLFVFFFCIGLSLFVSPSLKTSATAWISKWGEGILLFYMAQVFLKRKSLIIIVSVFCVSACVVSIDGIYQLIRGVDFIRGFDLMRINNLFAVRASFRHYNNFASFLIVIFFVCSGIVFSSKNQRMRMFTIVVMFLICVNLLFTYSRGGWLSFVLVLFLLDIFLVRRRGRLLFVALGLLPLIALFIFPSFRDRILLYGDAGRFTMWRAAWAMFKESPLLGKGLGLFMEFLPRYANVGHQYAHNCYLQVLAETGLVGFVPFMSFLGMLLFSGYALVCKKKDYLLMGIMLGVTAFLIHSFFDTQLFTLKLSILFWLFASFIVICLRSESLDVR